MTLPPSPPLLQNLTNCFPNSIYFEFRRSGGQMGETNITPISGLALIPQQAPAPSTCTLSGRPSSLSDIFPTKITLRGWMIRILATKSELKQKFSLSCLRYLLFHPPSCRNRAKIHFPTTYVVSSKVLVVRHATLG